MICVVTKAGPTNFNMIVTGMDSSMENIINYVSLKWDTFALMTKQAFIMLVVLIGMFSIPKISTACTSMSAAQITTMPCCRGENTSYSTKSSIQVFNSTERTITHSHLGANSHQQKSQDCHCLSLVNSLFIIDRLNLNLAIYVPQKYSLLYDKPLLPVGYYSIWLPPKI